MSAESDAVLQRLRELEDEVRVLRARVSAEISPPPSVTEVATVQSSSTPVSSSDSGRETSSGPPRGNAWSRRALLLGGAAAAVGGAASLASAAPAAATVGTMQYGTTNNSGSDGTRLVSSAFFATLSVENSSAGGGAGVPAHALSAQCASPSGAAVNAFGNGAGAVRAQSTGARGLVAGAIYGRGGDNCGVVAISDTGAPLRVGNAVLTTVPTTGTWTAGDFVQVNGALWFCVVSGTPGSWRLLASASAAGAFVPITPARIYDSRFNTSVDSGVGPLASGGTRRISVAKAYTPNTNTVAIDNVVPAGARAVSINLTITGPTGSGYMFIAPGTAMAISGSSINWPSANITLANGLTVGLDTARRLKAFLQISGGVGSCHFLVDVNGYFLGH